MMTNTLKRLSRIDLKLLQEKRDESYCKTKVLCIENKGGNKGQWCPLRKSVGIRSFSGPYFPQFGLNTEKYSVFLRTQY